MNEERRIVEVVVSRSPAGNVDNYQLPLKNGTLFVTEGDERQGFGIHFTGGEFEIQRDESGQPTGFHLRVGDYVYYDLTGDGRIDGYLGPKYTAFIWLDSRFIPVRGGKGGLDSLAVAPDDSSLEYHYRFRDGKWQRVDGHLYHYEHRAGE